MSSSNPSRPFAVLVVEDEPLLRLHAINIVEEAGFVAIEAKNADEAMAILGSRSDIALLLTDVQMPGSMDGLKLAHAVSRRWPPIKIVVMSGHVMLDQEYLPKNSRFFGKPFQAEKMIPELREMIDA